jgi:hypothetical protein
MKCEISGRLISARVGVGAEMLVTAVMTIICAAGIGFYIRFLLALREEGKPRMGGYWMRLRLTSNAKNVVELYPHRKARSRAA